MEYRRRRRYTSYKSQSKAKGMIAFVLIAATALAGILAFSPVGDYVTEHILNPIMMSIHSKDKKTQETLASGVNAPSPSPSGQPVRTDTFMVKSNPFYMLQMGQYTSEEDAKAASVKLQTMGGGGYVIQADGFFRLFAAAYTDEESLTSVRQQIRRDGFENDAYITDAKTVRITLHGAEEAVALFEDAIAIVQEIPTKLSELSLDYDKQLLDKAAIGNSLQAYLEGIEQTIEKLESIDSEDLYPVENVLQKYQTAISTFLLSHDSIGEDLYAGALKYLQMELIHAYTGFFEDANE